MTIKLPKISIKKGREWPIATGHPWLFSGGISQAPKGEAGDLVDLVDVDGRFVARGYYNPACDIAVRVLTRDASVSIDQQFFQDRISAAKQLRDRTIDQTTTNVFRLVNAEGDFLPGYIVDYYDGTLVVQSHTAGGDKLLPAFLDALEAVMKPTAIVVRNDSMARKREGLGLQEPQVIRGSLAGEVTVKENNCHFIVDVIKGQKTGFFSDQRDKRVALKQWCTSLSADSTLVNCFSYSGAFSVYAVRANTKIKTINVDESQRALDEAKRNFATNNLSVEGHEFVAQDAFAWLDSKAAREEVFDVVIVDPPAFAKTHKEKEKALKAYRRLDRLALSVCKPGALLITCSCSGSVSLAEFEAALKEATQDSGRSVQIIQTFAHGADHPITAVTPEANYLKVLFCRVLN